MSQQIQHTDVSEVNEKDVTHNWVNASRFLFYVHVWCIVAFLLSGCYTLYTHRYKGKPEVEISPSTLYMPQYK